MIDVQNIYKTFFVPHEVKALVDVSCKIKAGEVVVVCGPSGSGKSTLLRCMNRLERAESGHIVIDGIDVLSPKTNINKVRAEVGMVFQSFNLFPHKNVYENVTIAQLVVRKRSIPSSSAVFDLFPPVASNALRMCFLSISASVTMLSSPTEVDVSTA